MAGVGHLDIGIGQGPAQVFNPNPGIAQFGQILAQRKAKQDADNKYLADTLAQAKPDGLRNDADRTNFFNKYQKLKDQGIAAENEPDKLKKAMALANVRQGVMDLNSYVDQSKKQAAKENSFAQAYMQNPTAWSDESIDQHRKSTNLAVDDPSVVKDYTTLARRPDYQKLQESLKKDRDDLVSGIQGEDMITGRQKVGNKMVNTIQTKYTADPEDVSHHFLNRYDIDPNFQHYLVSQYGHSIPQGLQPQGQKAALVSSYIKNELGDDVSKYGPVKDKPDAAPDRFYEHEQWLIDHGLKTADGQLTPAQTAITNMQKGVHGSGEKILSLAPQGQYGDHKPYIHQDQAGNHIFMFPPQIDPKAIEYNKAILKKWSNDNPGEPYDPTDKDYKQKQAIIKPGKTYTLNPTSNTYVADAAQMASEQNINLSHLNQIESKKGGRGQIPEAANGVQQLKPQGSYQHTQTAKDANGKVFTLGFKNGKWYDTKTNKEWGQ